MSFDKEMVRVFNYGPCSVALQTNERSVLIKGTFDSQYPTMETFSLKELEYVNAHSPAIRSGIVEFADEDKEEIYKALHLNNWKDICIFERDIDEMLITPTVATMQKVTAVKDLPTIDRIYSHMVRLIHANQEDVSNRVQKVVEGRRSELRENIMTSRIQLIPKKVEEAPVVSQTDINEMVKAQVAEALAAMNMPAPVEAKEEVATVVTKQETKKPVAKPKKTTRTTSKTVPK